MTYPVSIGQYKCDVIVKDATVFVCKSHQINYFIPVFGIGNFFGNQIYAPTTHIEGRKKKRMLFEVYTC